MALRVELFCFLEEVFTTHCRAVIHRDGERVGRVSFAVGCRELLAGDAAAKTDTGRRPETKGFFDDGKCVVEVIDEVGVLLEDSGDCRGVFAKELVVLGADALKDFGVLA